MQHPLATTALLFMSATTLAQGDKPHIILIMTDQQRFDALGCINNTFITPHLDQLVQEGNLFTAAYSSTPSSTPARAGLLTGMSPWQHGMLGYGRQATYYPYTMPRLLNSGGYATMGLGKMHYNPQRNTHGFDVVVCDESGRVEDKLFMSDYRQWFHNVAFGQDPDKTGVSWNSHQAKVYQLDEHLHPTQWTGDIAVDAIEGYRSEKPLMLKVSFARPHSPYDPPQRYLDYYKDRAIDAPRIGEWTPESWSRENDPNKNKDAAIGAFGDAYAINSRRHYNASVTFIDDQIGRIISALKEKGMYDNALIFFISDHGDMLGDHHLWRKTYAYEGSAAIPFIVKLPKQAERVVKEGEHLNYPVEIRDILPTMLDIAGVKQPNEMDGRSLLPLLQEKNPNWRKYIDLEHTTAYWGSNYWMALTDGDMKYIWNRVTGEEQLFDMVSDPYEIKNLIGKRKYKQIEKIFRQAMVDHLSIRGEEWVKDGKLLTSKKVMIYNDNYPGTLPGKKKKGQS